MSKRTALAVVLAATLLAPALPASAQNLFTVALTRFGPCLGSCVVEVLDNGPLDSNPALHVIDYSVPIVGQAPTTYTAAGHAVETFVLDASGRATSIAMQLTNATVQGLAGASIPGQVALVSSVPLVAPFGVSGFASLTGDYRSFVGGAVGSTDLLLQARVGGLLLGLVNPPPVNGVASPFPFPFPSFSAMAWPIPVDNLLLGLFDFSTVPGSGFFLPGSGEVGAVAIPEPSTVWLVLGGLLGLSLRRRIRAR